MQQPEDVAGAIFGCTDQTESECLSRKLFGLKGTSWNTVSQVVQGMPLWLYNFERKILRGVFYAAGSGTYNLNPLALQGNPSTGSAFPAQCSVTWEELKEPVPLSVLQQVVPQIFYSHSKFRFSLGQAEVEALLEVFGEGRAARHTHQPVYRSSQQGDSSWGHRQPHADPKYDPSDPSLGEDPGFWGSSSHTRGEQLDAHASGMFIPGSFDPTQLQRSFHGGGGRPPPLPPPRLAPPLPPPPHPPLPHPRSAPLPPMGQHALFQAAAPSFRPPQHASNGAYQQYRQQHAQDRTKHVNKKPRPHPKSLAVRELPFKADQRRGAGLGRHANDQCTISIRNLPRDFDPDALVDMLDGPGQLQGHYDFLYVFHNTASGHDSWWAVINFTSTMAAGQIKAWLHLKEWHLLIGRQGSGNGTAFLTNFSTEGRAALQREFADHAVHYEGPPSQYHILAEQPTFFYDEYALDVQQQQRAQGAMKLPPRSVSFSAPPLGGSRPPPGGTSGRPSTSLPHKGAAASGPTHGKGHAHASSTAQDTHARLHSALSSPSKPPSAKAPPKPAASKPATASTPASAAAPPKASPPASKPAAPSRKPTPTVPTSSSPSGAAIRHTPIVWDPAAGARPATPPPSMTKPPAAVTKRAAASSGESTREPAPKRVKRSVDAPTAPAADAAKKLPAAAPASTQGRKPPAAAATPAKAASRKLPAAAATDAPTPDAAKPARKAKHSAEPSGEQQSRKAAKSPLPGSTAPTQAAHSAQRHMQLPRTDATARTQQKSTSVGIMQSSSGAGKDDIRPRIPITSAGAVAAGDSARKHEAAAVAQPAQAGAEGTEEEDAQASNGFGADFLELPA